MANIFGKEKKVMSARTLYTGIAKVIPIAFNPTKEQLSAATNGDKDFDNDIKYKFSDAEGGESYKFDMWCKLQYVKDEVGNLVQAPTPITNGPTTDSSELTTDYIVYSWWGRNKQDIFYTEDQQVKGIWYVSNKTCGMEWVPKGDVDAYISSRKKTQLDYSLPSTYIATQGEKELFQFLDRWLMIEEVNFGTNFLKILRGDYTEVNKMLRENLSRTDREPRGLKLFLGIKETEDNKYQSVYSYPMAESQNSYTGLTNSLSKREWKDNRSGSDLRFKIYAPEDVPTSNATVSRPPTQSSW